MYPHRLHTTSKRRRVVYRNKLIIIAISVMMIASCSIFVGSKLVHAQTADVSGNQTYYKSIEIQQGETLWEIAERYRNEETQTIKEYIAHIKEINNLDTDIIQEGGCLTVAYYASAQLASK